MEHRTHIVRARVTRHKVLPRYRSHVSLKPIEGLTPEIAPQIVQWCRQCVVPSSRLSCPIRHAYQGTSFNRLNVMRVMIIIQFLAGHQVPNPSGQVDVNLRRYIKSPSMRAKMEAVAKPTPSCCGPICVLPRSWWRLPRSFLLRLLPLRAIPNTSYMKSAMGIRITGASGREHLQMMFCLFGSVSDKEI